MRARPWRRSERSSCSGRPLADFNPIEMVFSKLKALLRKAAARTVYDGSVVADCLPAFIVEECQHYFEAAGYDPD